MTLAIVGGGGGGPQESIEAATVRQSTGQSISRGIRLYELTEGSVTWSAASGGCVTVVVSFTSVPTTRILI